MMRSSFTACFILAGTLLFLPVDVFCGPASIVGVFEGALEPDLVSPCSVEITLDPGAGLLFRWMPEIYRTDRFEFRLYSGYSAVADSLVLKKIVPAHASSLELDRDLFADGRVYTWSLVRVLVTGEKSGKAFASFRVKKL